jgi:predicted transcriptional regulator
MYMDKLVIKLSSEMDSDIKDLFSPKKSINIPKNILYVNNSKQLSSILSSERLALLLNLNKTKMDVSTTAKKLNRKQEAISRDATILEQFGLIKKTKKGKQVFLEPRIKKIEIEFC